MKEMNSYRTNIMEQKLLAYLKEHETEIFEDLKSLVLTEASTSDIDALAHVREKLMSLIKERTGGGSVLFMKRRMDIVRYDSSMEQVRRKSCLSVITTRCI